MSRSLSGWGNVPVESCHAYRPDRSGDIAEILDHSEEVDFSVRGNGRSYGDASLNEDRGVLLTERLDRLLSFDPESCILSAEASVTLADIIEVFLPRGFFFPVTPGTKHITLGGAIAADVHGKNHHRDGSMSGVLLDFRLLLASGELIPCSRDENADIFWATVGGMGLTGVITEARIRMRPVETAYIQVDYERAPDLDVALQRTFESDGDYAYAATWIDCLARGRNLGRSVLMRGNPAPIQSLPPRLRTDPRRAPASRRLTVPFNLPGFVLNRTSMRAFNTCFYHAHRNGTRHTPYDPYFYPLDSIDHWNRIYGSRGVVQYQFVLPPDRSRAGLIEVLEQIPRSSGVSFLAVLKSFGPGGDGLLSFPRPGHTLALDFPNTGAELFGQLAKLDEIVLRHGGRVYLAKDCCLSPAAFRQMYPRVDEFKAVKNRIDPDQRFSSSLARRLGIVETS